MVIIPPFRILHHKKNVAAPSQLVLVSAAYDAENYYLDLTFNQPVNIDAYNGTQITLNDPETTHARYNAVNGAELLSANVVRVVLDGLGASSGTITRFSATSTTGIVAVNGAIWSGVTDQPV